MEQFGEFFSILSGDQRLALLMAVVLALGGIALATAGVWLAAMPESGLARWNRSYLARDLVMRVAGGASGDPAEIDALTRRLWQSYGWSFAGGGLGAAIGAGAIACLAVGVAGSLVNVVTSGPNLLEAVFFQGFTLGLALGYLLGTFIITRRVTVPVWTDLRRRRVNDYRAGWLGWGPFALAGLTILTLAIALFSQLPRQGAVSNELHIARNFLPTLPIPILAALAVWALLIPIIGALLCRWIAISPRALTSTDPRIALAADEMRRAISIGHVVSYTWVSSGLTLGAVAMVALTLASGLGDVLQWLLLILGGLAMALGISLNGLRGRLGGRVMGWPSLQSLLAELRMS